MRKVVLIGVVAVILLGGGGYWYYFEGPCGVNVVKAAAEEIQAVYDDWEGQLRIADSTPRIGLSTPMNELQHLKNEAEDIEVPACMEKTHSVLIQAMDSATNGFLAFMGQESDLTVATHFDVMGSHLETYSKELEKVMECAPFCP